MEPVALGFGAVLVMGLVFGAGACNVACLPYLGPVFFGRVRPWQQVAAFSVGRIVGYVGIAGAAGALGHAASQALESRAAGVVLGAAAFTAGLVLVFKRRQGGCAAHRGVAVSKPGCDSDVIRMVPSSSGRGASGVRSRALPVALFVMGIGMALNPCVPLATVLLAAAASASLWNGAWLGLGFGLGAVVVPSVVFGWLMARFGLEVRAQLGRWRPQLERGAGALLMSLGVFTLMGWVHP